MRGGEKNGHGLEEYVPCVLCGSRESDVIFKASDKVIFRDDREYPVVKCRNCGLVFLNPRPSAEMKEQLYGTDYPFTADKPDNAQPIFHYQPVIDYLEGMGPGKVLDVGTGNSPFLPAMKGFGWEVNGTEVDVGLVEYFHEKHGIEVFGGELEDAHFDSGYFDAVTIMGVIEHVPNPRLMLSEAARILRDDGVLAMWCFNRSVEARLLGKYWLGFDAPRHFYSYSYETMARLLKETGFELTDSLFRPICYTVYSGVWAATRLRNRFRKQDGPEIICNLKLPRILELASRPVGKALSRRQLSSNMYLFARKVAS